MQNIINWLFDHQSQAGVVSLLICVGWCAGARVKAKKPINEEMLSPFIFAAFAGFTLHQSFFLLYCSFDLDFLKKMEDLPLFLGAGSVSAILIAVITAVKAISDARG